MRPATRTIGAVLLASALAGPAFAAQSPQSMPDHAFIGLTGTVANPKGDNFTLNYDGGSVLVELSEWKRSDKADLVKKGDRVTVYGLVDNDLFEKASIEANTVYDYNQETYFYGNNADEEGWNGYPAYYPWADGNYVAMTGRVTKVNGRMFTLQSASRDVKIDTESMTYNPLDKKGYPRISVGDEVSVYGTLDKNVFAKSEIDATFVAKLSRGPGPRTAF